MRDRPEDCVAILAETRDGRFIAALAIRSVPGVAVPVCAANTAGQAANLFPHAALQDEPETGIVVIDPGELLSIIYTFETKGG